MNKSSDWKNAVVMANYLRRQENYRMYDYQAESILCPNPRKALRAGRDVGKTTEIEITHLYFALANPRTESLIAAQWEHNLAPTAERLIATCTRHPEIARHVTRVVRSPFMRIEFDNGSLLLGKIAGSGGVNFQNTHVHLISVDEAQNLFEISWQQLFPALLTGGRLHVYGVPNGLRNRYYHLTHEKAFAQFHWPSRLNPAYTPAKDEEMATLYGGRECAGYIHNILGEHGSPEESVFALDLVERCLTGPAEFQLVIRQGSGEDEVAHRLEAFRNEMPEGGRIVLGCDVGYAQDPTVVSVWHEDGGLLTGGGILEMRHTPYLRQAEILIDLLRVTEAEWLGMDRGGGGESVIENIAALCPPYASRILRGSDGRYGFLFHESIELELHGSGMRRRMKIAATEKYRRLMETGRLQFSSQERAQQMIAHTCASNARGDIVYAKGDDHILDADRCVMYGLILEAMHRDAVRRDFVAVRRI